MRTTIWDLHNTDPCIAIYSTPTFDFHFETLALYRINDAELPRHFDYGHHVLFLFLFWLCIYQDSNNRGTVLYWPYFPVRGAATKTCARFGPFEISNSISQSLYTVLCVSQQQIVLVTNDTSYAIPFGSDAVVMLYTVISTEWLLANWTNVALRSRDLFNFRLRDVVSSSQVLIPILYIKAFGICTPCRVIQNLSLSATLIWILYAIPLAAIECVLCTTTNAPIFP